jgi:hypothetical protein
MYLIKFLDICHPTDIILIILLGACPCVATGVHWDEHDTYLIGSYISLWVWRKFARKLI